jgi:hypothetical protein
VDETLHIIVLVAQLSSLTFLSYNQGHKAPIQPFYLDSALERIYLLGKYDMSTAPYWTIAEPVQLSCLDDMLHSPVIVFSVQRRFIVPSFKPLALKHNVVAYAEDVLGESSVNPTIDQTY